MDKVGESDPKDGCETAAYSSFFTNFLILQILQNPFRALYSIFVILF